MKKLHVLVVVAMLGAGATSAAAQGVTLEFQDGKVRLTAQNVPVSLILSEWARRGRTTIVNGERVPGPPITIELQDVSEQQALDILLRSASGYLVGARETAMAGASSFDRIYILPTSSRPTTAAPPPPQQAQQTLQVQDNFDDDEPAPGPRPPNVPPGARLPRDVGPPSGPPNPPGRLPAALDDDRGEPENRPTPAPANPFNVPPGTVRPGVVTPGAAGATSPGVITPAAPGPNTPGPVAPAPQPNRPNNQ
jgi:hypothetical protein